MPDSRFFQTSDPIALADLARVAGATLADPSMAAVPISAIAPLSRATSDSATFFSDRRYLTDLKATHARACFVPQAHSSALPEGCTALIVSNPHAAYALVADKFYSPHLIVSGGSNIHSDVVMEDGVALSPGVVIGAGVKIGAGTVIGANTVIGPGVSIGRQCWIGSNVVIGFALLGDRIRVLAGAVIGEAGFGVTGGQTGAIDVPQLGRVILQDGVTVGANSCIDRGRGTTPWWAKTPRSIIWFRSRTVFSWGAIACWPRTPEYPAAVSSATEPYLEDAPGSPTISMWGRVRVLRRRQA